MKKRLQLFIGFLFAGIAANAQISSLPATESFDGNFTTGSNVEFITNWTGNDVSANNRIFRDETDYNSAPAALSVIPTGSFDGVITANLNLSSYSSVLVSMQVKSMQNGTGSRPTSLTVSTSVDGGATWIASQVLGEFPNTNQTEFTSLSYNIPAEANNQADVLLRLDVQTGTGGTGTRAKLVIDDVNFTVSTTAAISANQNSLNLTQVLGFASAAQEIVVSGTNLMGNVSLSVPSPFEISLNVEGDYSQTLQLNEVNGLLAETTVYVRLNNSDEGSIIEDLMITSNGAESLSISLMGTTLASSITAPDAFNLSGGTFTFNQWSAEAEAGTYPANMVFWTHEVTDPSSDALFMENYNCLYNLTSRSRFSGLGEEGIAMVNTGNSQYVGVCDGSDPTQSSGETNMYGRAGAVVIALNTTNNGNIVVNWTGRTINQNNRIYSLRLQYKLGNTDLNSGWIDIVSENGNTEYVSGETGSSDTFETTLPEAVNNQETVLLRWVYNHVDTGASGSRAEIALDDVTIAGQTLSTNDFIFNNSFTIYPNPVKNGKLYLSETANVSIYDISGRLMTSLKEVSEVNTQSFSKGLYILKTGDGKTKKFIVE